jgi:DNA-binding CsgD family transcriptional regulator
MSTLYTTQKGTVTPYRPFGILQESERREILLALETMKNKEVRMKYNISKNTVSHLRYHCQHLLEGIETMRTRVQQLRGAGMNSMQVAENLGLSLEQVNKLWK